MFHSFNELLPLAYLDSGTGSMIIQAVLGGFLTAGYVVRSRWSQIRIWIDNLSHRSH
jgi:hypothetical protein